MTDPIHVTDGSLADLRSQLLGLGVALDNAATSGTTPAGGAVTTGAGELVSEFGDGIERFTTGWSMFLSAASDDASILGNSVGKASVDFHAVDAAVTFDQTVTL